VKFIRIAVPPTTSYANTGGTGNRSSSITVTTDIGLGGSSADIQIMVNGTNPESVTYFSGSAVSGKFIKFDFGSGQSKFIDTLKWDSARCIRSGHMETARL
jgi:hypothetical protein